ncbi:Uncharacterized protein DBV15_08737 [Temnothorax longispinosus]|uniref:Uncharacterized protein n=1 Tax=Temnothorax longispinosus TaxID=300112 RepID=A0A4S2KUL8_9HYME|nr:Uncharacterized protein DBV15_08737 [Temnothorax longispinosus]
MIMTRVHLSPPRTPLGATAKSDVPGIWRRCQEYDDASSQVAAKTRLKRSPCSEKTLCDTCVESVIYGRSVSRERSRLMMLRSVAVFRNMTSAPQGEALGEVRAVPAAALASLAPGSSGGPCP